MLPCFLPGGGLHEKVCWDGQHIGLVSRPVLEEVIAVPASRTELFDQGMVSQDYL